MFHLIAKFRNGEYEIPHWQTLSKKSVEFADVPKYIEDIAKWRLLWEYPKVENPITVAAGMAHDIVRILNEHDRKKEKACLPVSSK